MPDSRPRFGLHDVLASLVVFLVALPLCLAVAEASGLPAQAGILTGIVGGLVVGLLAGSPLQVSGPAAGLIVLVLDVVHRTEAEPSKYALVIVLAGGFQLAAGLAGLGHWFRAVSPAVVLGMLAGIGAIILAKQSHVLFDTAPPAGVLDAVRRLPGTAATALDGGRPAQAAAVSGAALLVIVLWELLAPRRARLLPAAVLAVTAATLLAELAGLDVNRVRVGGLADWFAADNRPRFVFSADPAALLDPFVWQAAAVIALIASAETLLCAVAVDSKHAGPRTRFNRELAAQGVGNLLCGAVAALPMTGVIVRSAANLQAGAKTRWSAVLHGVWLLLSAVWLTAWLGRVPMAALAAVLVFSGWKLLDLPAAFRLWRASRGEGGVFLLTVALVVSVDLLTGVAVGLAVSAARLLWVFARLSVRRQVVDGEVHLHLSGAATFLRLPLLADELDNLPRRKAVHLHLEELRLVDHAVLEQLSRFKHQYEKAGGHVSLDFEHLNERFKTPRTGGTTVEPRLEGIDSSQPSVTSDSPASKAGTG